MKKIAEENIGSGQVLEFYTDGKLQYVFLRTNALQPARILLRKSGQVEDYGEFKAW